MFFAAPPVANAPAGITLKKVLVVDDNPVILKTLAVKLQGHGYAVLTAEDGAGAVAIVRRDKPDIILLDLSFPTDQPPGGGVLWDGFLIMKWLRRLEEAKDIPIIAITGADPEKSKGPAMEAGATNFFHKPIDHEELFTVIGQILEQKDGKLHFAI
jgi:CheY-like chemotaxis protein